jgi:tRNA G37 N-methylase Trm5
VVRRAWVYRLRFAGHGFCETLCLADVNPEAVEACRLTVARNGLSKRVAVCRSENLDGIPDPNAGIWLLAIRRVMSALPPKADIGTGTRITFGAPAPAAWRYSPQFHCTRLSYVYHESVPIGQTFPMRARRGI